VTRVLVVLLALGGWARAACSPPKYYGVYSVGTKAGDGKVTLASRLGELRAAGTNMIVGTGEKADVLARLPPGMLAVPGCGLMHARDWKRGDEWDDGEARAHLASLAGRFANDPRVYGICVTHEVDEYADHARRRWIYELAKKYFPKKKVIQYYGHVWDTVNPEHERRYAYGERGEVETDVLFVSLQAARADGRFELGNAQHLEEILKSAARTPGIPVWVQTSINADHRYVKGPDTMLATWGTHAENMRRWTDAVFSIDGPGSNGDRVRLEGFFWRSFGRFPYDLGYPAFVAHRAAMRDIGVQLCPHR